VTTGSVSHGDRVTLEPGSIASCYEALRRAAFGEPVSPEDRTGLVIFLHRGMWGWARATLTQTTTPRPRTHPMRRSAAHPQHTFVRAFAAMAMDAHTGRE